MFNSFLIKVQSLQECEIENCSFKIYKLLEESLNKALDGMKIHDKLQNSDLFTVSGFLSQNNEKAVLNEGKYYFIRVTTLQNKVFSIITASLFKLMMCREPITISDNNFKVLDIICNKEKSKWADVLNEEKIETIMNEGCYDNEIKIKLITPAYWDEVKNPLSKLYNFKEILKEILVKFSTYTNVVIDEFAMLELEKINIYLNNVKQRKIHCNNNIQLGVYGEIAFEISALSEISKKVFKILINILFFLGIGTGTRYGYGQISIINGF